MIIGGFGRIGSRAAVGAWVGCGMLTWGLLAGGSALRADTLIYDDNFSDFGHVAQNVGGDINNGQVACGPTSVYNSFVFLKNKYGVDLTGTSAADTINSLETYMKGTNADFNGVQKDTDLVNGKETYIADQGLSSKVVVESLVSDPDAIPANDAAEFIYNQLKQGQDVEIGFFWSDSSGDRTNFSGGHWVTVTGINFDTTTEFGSMNVVDPWAPNGDTTAQDIIGQLTVSNDKLIFGYTGGAAGNDGDASENPEEAGFGFITGIAAESVVPLPAAVWGGLALLLGVGVGRRWQAKSVA